MQTDDALRLLRELAPQALGVVARRFRDFAAAEDAVQEAMIAAATQWPRDGVPDNPRGWLIQVAQRRMTDHIRSEIARRNREAAVGAETPDVALPDLDLAADIHEEDALVLFFMCCHPALTRASQIALTLRAVGGLTTGEIAHAFLAPEATIGQRISRAKQTIKASGIPFELPGAAERGERLAAVLHTLYLIFNEGYVTSAGTTLQRSDLASEAIRLTRQVHKLTPDNGEALGLLALMLLTDARRTARTGQNGELIPLDEQDRTLWDRAAIDEGLALAGAALERGLDGPYQIQAAIAALHDEAPSADKTDWPEIVALYAALMDMGDNPMVALNHAIAAAMAHGPAVGLDLLAPLQGDARLADGHRLDAARAHLLERAGDHIAAEELYRAAASKTASLPERNYLLMRAARLREIH